MSKSDQTRERILRAATEEFAAFGGSGARVDRIAQAANANKALIYSYFGNKDQVFDAVMGSQLEQVYSAVTFTSGDLPGYAAALFDFAMDNPQLMRLVMWHSLEQRKTWPLDTALSLPSQVSGIADAQADGQVSPHYPPDFLLTLVITMASAWTAANPFGRTISENVAARRAELKSALARAVGQIVASDQPNGQ